MNIQFYPTISRNELKWLQYDHVLLTASSFAAENIRNGTISRKGIAKVNLPIPIKDDFRDCGGFVASFKYGGKYPYTEKQYLDWLYECPPTRAAMMDLCCEEELISRRGIVKERQDITTENAYHFWREYKHAPWIWVPTLQGWNVKDYLYHVSCMKKLIYEMNAFYPDFRVGIGTLCHRATPKMIHSIVCAINKELPGINFHLWGVKKTMLTSDIMLPDSVISVDSAAFNGMWGRGREEWKMARKSDGTRYKQGEYSLRVKLPRYMEDIEKGLKKYKQLSFQESE